MKSDKTKNSSYSDNLQIGNAEAKVHSRVTLPAQCLVISGFSRRSFSFRRLANSESRQNISSIAARTSRPKGETVTMFACDYGLVGVEVPELGTATESVTGLVPSGIPAPKFTEKPS